MAATFRILTGLLLVSSGALKVLDFEGFQVAVRGYRIVRDGYWSTVVAAVVTMFECLLGIALMMGWFLWASSGLTMAMLGVFSLVVMIVVVRGEKNINCGCKVLGRTERIGWQLCCRNAALGCFLVPSVLRLSMGYSLAVISAGMLLLIISVVTANPGEVNIRGTRVRQLKIG